MIKGVGQTVKLPRGSVVLKKDDLECIRGHYDAFFELKRVPQDAKFKLRLIMEHLTGEIT
jgi:hypothetical protein